MESEFPITLKVIKAIPNDQGDYKPHERSQSAKEIVQTIISETTAIVNALAGNENIFTPISIPSLDAAVQMYQEECSKTLEFVKQTSETDLQKPLEGMMGNFFPRRIDGAWMFLDDSIHHRGQLSVYIRMSGGKVPSIYGPSADENPFL